MFRGFAIVDLLIILTVGAVIVALALPAKVQAPQCGQKLKNMDNLRRIHEGLVSHASENRDITLA